MNKSDSLSGALANSFMNFIFWHLIVFDCVIDIMEFNSHTKDVHFKYSSTCSAWIIAMVIQ